MAPRYHQNTFTLVPNPLGMQGLVARSRMTAAAIAATNSKSRSNTSIPGTGTGTGDNPSDPTPIQSKPPMTSKQAQKLYRKQTRVPKVSREEQRRLDRLAQEEIRKELEKEKAASKARAARERKKEKEQQIRDARKRKGMPLVDVRPSQDTISRFVRVGGSSSSSGSGSGARGTKRDIEGREKKDATTPVQRPGSDRVLETLGEEEEGQKEEGGTTHHDQEKDGSGEPRLDREDDGESIPKLKRTRHGNAEHTLGSQRKATDRTPSPGKATIMDSQTSHGSPSSQRKQGRDGTLQPSPGCNHPGDSPGNPASSGENSPSKARPPQDDDVTTNPNRQQGAERSASAARPDALDPPQAATGNTGVKNQDCHVTKTRQEEANRPLNREKSVIEDVNKPQTSQPIDSVKESPDDSMKPPPRPPRKPETEKLGLATRSSCQEKPQPPQGSGVRPLPHVPLNIPSRNARPAMTSTPRISVPRFTVSGSAASRVPGKHIPPVPCFKKPSSRLSGQGVEKPKFTPRHIRLHNAPARSSGPKPNKMSMAPPSSTQLFVMSHLDELFLSPTQEARELEEIDTALPAPPAPSTKPITVLKTATTTISAPPRPPPRVALLPPLAFPADPARKSVPILAQQSQRPNSFRTAVLPASSCLRLGPASASLDVPFMSTQDFMSSQDVRELESLTPNMSASSAGGGNGVDHSAKQMSRLPPAFDSPTPLGPKVNFGINVQRQGLDPARSQHIRRPLHVVGAHNMNNRPAKRPSHVSQAPREDQGTHQAQQAAQNLATNLRETATPDRPPASIPRTHEIPANRSDQLTVPANRLRVSTPQSNLHPREELSRTTTGGPTKSKRTPHSSITSSASSSSPPKRRFFTSSGHKAQLLAAMEQSKRSHRQEECRCSREDSHHLPERAVEPKKEKSVPRRDLERIERDKENVPPSKNNQGIDEDELSAILAVVDDDGAIFEEDDCVALDLGLVPAKKPGGGAPASEARVVNPSIRKDKTKWNQAPTGPAPNRPSLGSLNQSTNIILPGAGKRTPSSNQEVSAKVESNSFGLSQEDFGGDLDGLDLLDFEDYLDRTTSVGR